MSEGPSIPSTGASEAVPGTRVGGTRHQISLVAGTILDSAKLPRRTGTPAIYMMKRTKTGISALKLPPGNWRGATTPSGRSS